jgi:metal-sulfur cluster biosynthetic enzyme
MIQSVPVTREQITTALRDVLDPELGMSVVDLGLIYGVEIEDERVRVTMTLTVPGCPIHDAMAEWVRQAVMKVPGVTEVEVAITFDPPWTPERITLAPSR